MADEVQLISDGNGLAVIGNEKAVVAFLTSEGLTSRELGLPRLKKLVGNSVVGLRAGADISENSGRWVKLTKESAEAVKKYGLMKSKTPGVSHGMVGRPGEIKQWLQIARGPGSFVANPAVLSSAAGIMTQLAMQQAMDEITDYLASIDQKLDDVLRAQKNAVLADMIGVDLVIEEAMTVREHVGRVSEVTWSKVQATGMAIARTQAYALGCLDGLAEKVEGQANIDDIAEASETAEATVREWLAVLARCFQLQDAIAVLELDRVLDVSPDELDQHRIALHAARQRRRDLISGSTGRLVARLDAAARHANTRVLMHPAKAPVIVRASNNVATTVLELDERLGIEQSRESLASRRWVEAVGDVKDRTLEAGADRIDTARRRGGETLDRARSIKGGLTNRFAERAKRRREDTPDE